jgi:hypothetical protein
MARSRTPRLFLVLWRPHTGTSACANHNGAWTRISACANCHGLREDRIAVGVCGANHDRAVTHSQVRRNAPVDYRVISHLGGRCGAVW